MIVCEFVDTAESMTYTYFEIIRTSRQELITDMQGLRRVNAAKVLLTNTHTPRLITDIDEHIIATWTESTSAHLGNGEGKIPLKAQKGSREPTIDLSTVF